MTLQETIKHLKEVCKKEGLDADSNNILDNAVKIMISNNINQSKKENIKSMSNYQKKEIINPIPTMTNKPIDSPTSKQLIALSKMGYTKEQLSKLTKKDAWKIISESKEY